MALKNVSKYFQELSEEAKSRYEEKLGILGDIEDPYVGGSWLVRGSSVEWHDWPTVEYPDIYNYLIATPSAYTRDQLKAYKSLDAYNFVKNGWVAKLQVVVLPNRAHSYFVHARVRHSQKVSATPLHPWIGVEKNGTIICGHCDCMAGLGEACSHIAAVLFALEYNTRIVAGTTCTSLPCSWLPPSFQSVEYSPVAQIDFSLKTSTPQASQQTKRELPVSTPTEVEMEVFYKALSTSKPAILSLVSGFSDSYMPLSEQGILPRPLTSLFDPNALTMSEEDLRTKCVDIANTITVTAEQASCLEERTRRQASSKLWFQQRTGRVTASRLKQVVRTSLLKPSTSLIKAICYPESHSFRGNKVTAWGCEHEQKARTMYVKMMKQKPADFSVTSCGLFIDPSNPFMGASPDGIISCLCCGVGTLEIKCPFKCRHQSISEASDDSSFYIKKQDNRLSLDTSHPYYYQVQAQIKVTGADYGDFVAWTEQDVFTEHFYCEEDFISEAIVGAKDFFVKCVLLELVGSLHSTK